MPAEREPLVALGNRAGETGSGGRRATDWRVAHQNAERPTTGRSSQWGEPAKGRAGKMAVHGGGHPDLRRTDARDRRGSEGRDLPAHQSARGAGSGHSDDLIGAAGDSWDE